MWNETPSRIWRDVSETAHRADRLERVRQVTARVKAQLENLGTEADSLETARARYDNHAGSEAGAARTAARLMFVAAVLITLDVPVQYLLNSASLPGVSGWKVLLGSVALPLGIAAIIHYIVEPLIYDAARPARSIRIAKTLAASALLAVLAGATVFLFARQASGEIAGYIVSLTSASLWAVAEALPLTAGFVAMWAHMLAKPSQDAERLRIVKERIATWERLSERLSREELSLAGREDAPAEQRDRSEPMRLTSAMVLLILCAGLMPAKTSAQKPRTCAIFVDRSRSVDSLHRSEAIRLVIVALPKIVLDYRCERVVAGTFANEGEFAPRSLLATPQRVRTKDCELAPPPAPPGVRAVLLGVRGFNDHFRREAVEACLQEITSASARAQTEWARFRRAASAILAQSPISHETKTDIAGLLRSLERSNVCAVFLVTDGIDTAGSSSQSPRRARLVLVLVPAAPNYGGANATRRTARAWERAGATAMPYTVLVSWAPSDTMAMQ